MSLLDTPLRLGPLTLRNRIVFSAHLTNTAVDGLPTAQHVAYYAERAAGGAGLVITEEHSVHPDDRPYEKLLRGHDPAVVPGYRLLTAAVRAHGAAVLAQLNHNGGQSSGMYSRQPVRAPSAIADPMFREVPAALTVAEIAELVSGYALVARHCADGGFDGVELQCSHASLLRQFLSPLTNRRADAYGGALENRVRIVREVAAAVRATIGPGRALGVRICGDEGLAGGIPLAEAVATARLLEGDGHVDYINTSIGVATASLHLIEAPMPVRPGYARHIPAAIRAAVALPVIGVGRFSTREQAEATLDAGDCDLVGVVRGQIAEPAFARRPARTCIACNQECVGRVGLNRRLGCLVNPRAGQEALPLPAPSPRRRVLVVGGGPAGLQAAVTAAGRRHRVILCERSPSPGGQVAVAARGAGRAEFGNLVRDLEAQCRRLGVEIRTGVAVDAEAIAAVAPDAVVLATGARPARPDWGTGLDRVVDVRDVLDGRVMPSGAVLVYDELGFQEAASVAESLAASGCSTEIMTPAMVAVQDLGTTLDMELFHRRAHAAGIVMTTDRVVLGATAKGTGIAVSVLHHTVGTGTEMIYDWVVCAVPAEPEDELWKQLREGPLPVHRIGDCVAPRRADAAVREGHRVGVSL
ncbi:mycofactocin system FadH/OYE family oxidoreductase 2 [Pseudonocardia sp. GCM10023141]|uniref:mycofactocin system FadH/OYE family oxidoreductase 2 n=1 Tax=Pseudonocardia sp. GCM10023141 TaxID=3252653 RepID=UPI003616D48C